MRAFAGSVVYSLLRLGFISFSGVGLVELRPPMCCFVIALYTEVGSSRELLALICFGFRYLVFRLLRA